MSSSPEYFQKKVRAIVDGLQGALCFLTLIKNITEQNERLFTALKNSRNKNCVKCREVKILALQSNILRSCNQQKRSLFWPYKTAAIKEIKAPTNVTKLHIFMGIVNPLEKFSPHLAELSSPLENYEVQTSLTVGHLTRESIYKHQLKTELTNPTMLSYALRALTETKSHYAKIEKKALAIIWACERFSICTLGNTTS